MRVLWTEIVILAITVILLAYDVLAVKIGQPTESMVLRDWAKNWSTLPFVAGFLSGHWFGPRQHVSSSQWSLVLPVLILLLTVDVIYNVKFPHATSVPWWRYSMIYFLIGIPVGMYVWGQPGAWSPLK